VTSSDLGLGLRAVRAVQSRRTDGSFTAPAVTVTYRVPSSRKTDGSHGNLHYSRYTTKYTKIYCLR
jgi:hypothetical protein